MSKEDVQYIKENVMTHNRARGLYPYDRIRESHEPAGERDANLRFRHRYAEGLPGKRYYQGNIHVDKVEIRAVELAKRVFTCDYTDVRSVSGTVANIAVLFALDQSAQISTCEFGAFGQRASTTHGEWRT